MCTVSLIAVQAPSPGLRIVCNRDELRTRPPASPPRWHTLPSGGSGAGERGLWPTDTKAGGTWLGASERGLVLALLNYNPKHGLPTPLFPPRQSRGLIIPSLITSKNVAEVARTLSRMDFSLFPGFRLLAIDPPKTSTPDNPNSIYPAVLEATWNGRELGTTKLPPGPMCFASSGLGDHRALPRLDVFKRLVLEGGRTAEAQDEFHAHTWPAQPEISVMMSREDARTVSITTVHIDHTGPNGSIQVRMDYQPVLEREMAATGSTGKA